MSTSTRNILVYTAVNFALKFIAGRLLVGMLERSIERQAEKKNK